MSSPSPRIVTIGATRVAVLEALDASYANYTWASARLLAHKLAVETQAGRLQLEGQNLLELGCGTALPGLLAAMLGAARVVLTDAEAETAALLRASQAAALNGVADRVHVAPLNWGEWTAATVADLPDNFSLILAADCLYALADYEPFFATASYFLHRQPGSQLLMAYCDRISGRSFDPFLWRWQLECTELALDGLPEDLVEEAVGHLRLFTFRSATPSG